MILGIWRQLDREQTIEHPASYIYRAAAHETIRVLREESLGGLEVLDPEDVAAQVPAEDDPHAALAVKRRLALIRASIERLAPDRRRAVRAHLAGFAVAEIMHMNGWSYHKARNLIARGVADLRRALREHEIHG